MTEARGKEIRRRIEARRKKMGEGKHVCHWPTCEKAVPPKMWGCREHWFTLPKMLRDRIWATYVPGQEIRKDPSPAYLEAAEEVERWVKEEIKAGRAE